jgi:hypothetical protein
MMWSPPPSGIVVGGVQVSPSLDFEKSRSFPEQFARALQSGHAIITFPSAPTSTLGNGAARTADVLKREGAITDSEEKVAPPSVERTTAISLS